jgi:acetyl esterase
MADRSVRSKLEHALVTSMRNAPRIVRESLSIPSRGYEGDRLDDDLRLLLGMQSRAGHRPWSDLPLPTARAVFDRTGPLLSPRAAPLERVRDLTVGGPDGSALRAREYRPFGLTKTAPALVYFHGGGFVLGSIESHDGVCKMLAATAGCVVISVEYRLAPEHPWPASTRDAAAAFASVIAQSEALSIDPTRVAVGGDSAGGYLAAQVAYEAAAEGRAARPALQVLFYPAADFTMARASIRALGEGLLLEEKTIRWFVEQFVPRGMDRADPRLSPVFLPEESLSGLCPAHVQTAGFDPLRDEGAAYAARLASAGVAVEHVHYGSLVHGYLNVTEACPAALPAYFSAAAALRRAFKAAR